MKLYKKYIYSGSLFEFRLSRNKKIVSFFLLFDKKTVVSPCTVIRIGYFPCTCHSVPFQPLKYKINMH